MLARRLVVLMEEEEQRRLRRLASRRGVSVSEVVRGAIRRVLDEAPGDDVVSDAVSFLCEEHDPSFEWEAVKGELVRRFDG